MKNQNNFVDEENPSHIPSGQPVQDNSLKAAHTPGPWAVQKLNHIAGDLWLQIGLATGFGPIAGITGDDTAEPTFKPVAGMKYLVTPESEQWANARLIAAAPTLYEACDKARAVFKTMALRGERTPLSQIKDAVDALADALALADAQD